MHLKNNGPAKDRMGRPALGEFMPARACIQAVRMAGIGAASLLFGLTACGGGSSGSKSSSELLAAVSLPTTAPTIAPTPSGAMHSPNPNPVGPQPTSTPSAAPTARATASPTPAPTAAPTATPTPAPSPSAILTTIALTQCPTVTTKYLFVNGVPQVVMSGPFDFALICPNGASPPLQITYPPNRASGIEADVPNSGSPPLEVFSGLDAPGQLGVQTLVIDDGEVFGTTLTQCATTIVGISPPEYCDHVGYIRYWDKQGMIDFVYSYQAEMSETAFPK